MEIDVKAYAKLNLSLDVVSKMPSGYHEMRMVMQSVALCDDIHISAVTGNGFVNVSTNKYYLPRDSKNSAGKAASLFMKANRITGYNLTLEVLKRIPVCAGMAGGSTDAAAVLRGLNRLFGAGMSVVELQSLGEELGSDVPYCVAGGTVLAAGRGELLTPLPELPACHVVICKPAFSVSTPELFSHIRCERIRRRPDTEGLVKALESGDLSGVVRRTYNVFEDVLPQGAREIEAIKGKLYDHSALGASMSGTGPSVFGLFDSLDNARAAYDELSAGYEDCFLTETIKKLEI